MGTKKQVLLGAHMSIAGGLEKAIERGESIGCTCIQIFTKSNRQWKAKQLTDTEIEAFKEAVKHSSIEAKHIVCHAGYLINIANPHTAVHTKSTASLIEELERCEKLGIPSLVLHPGAYKEVDVALKTIAETIDHVVAQVPGKTKILLETMAGQGSTTCYTFEQIAQVYKLVKHKSRVGVCVDTCHIFAAGYDLRTKKAYDETWEQFDKAVGLSLLHAIHCNDSKKGLGSRVDRHADIGKGELGLEAFKLLFTDKRLADIPKILETPQTSDDLLHDYKRNMDVIEKLIEWSEPGFLLGAIRYLPNSQKKQFDFRLKSEWLRVFKNF